MTARASKEVSIDNQYSSLVLIGGADVHPDFLSRGVDLRVEGGVLIRKKLLVLGNICVNDTIIGDVEGNIVTGHIQAKELTEGIVVVGNVCVSPENFVKSNLITRVIQNEDNNQIDIYGDVQFHGNLIASAITTTTLNTTLITAGNAVVSNATVGNLFVNTATIHNAIISNIDLVCGILSNVDTIEVNNVKRKRVPAIGEQIGVSQSNVIVIHDPIVLNYPSTGGGGRNLFLGYSSGLNTGIASSDNTLVGYDAGKSLGNVTGVVNIGSNVMSSTTSLLADDTVAIGHEVMKNSSGIGNKTVAIGKNVLVNSIVGFNSVAIGCNTSRYTSKVFEDVIIGGEAVSTSYYSFRDVAIGVSALKGNALSTPVHFYNVAVGFEAFKNVDTGAYRNVVVGHQGGATLESGAYNVIIGGGANVANKAQSSTTVIGYGAATLNDDTVVVGSGAVGVTSRDVQLGAATSGTTGSLIFREQIVSQENWKGGGLTGASIDNDGNIIRGNTSGGNAAVTSIFRINKITTQNISQDTPTTIAFDSNDPFSTSEPGTWDSGNSQFIVNTSAWFDINAGVTYGSDIDNKFRVDVLINDVTEAGQAQLYSTGNAAQSTTSVKAYIVSGSNIKAKTTQFTAASKTLNYGFLVVEKIGGSTSFESPNFVSIFRRNLTTPQSISDGVSTPVQFNVNDANNAQPSGTWDSGTYKFTANVDAWYEINAGIKFGSDIDNKFKVEILVNGVVDTGQSQLYSTGNTAQCATSVKTYMSAGSLVNVNVTQFTGSSKTLDSGYIIIERQTGTKSVVLTPWPADATSNLDMACYDIKNVGNIYVDYIKSKSGGNVTIVSDVVITGNLTIIGSSESGWNGNATSNLNMNQFCIVNANCITSNVIVVGNIYGFSPVTVNDDAVFKNDVRIEGNLTLMTHPLYPANGGTGISSYTVGDLLYASGSTTLTKLPIGNIGMTLTVSGNTIPSWDIGYANTVTADGTLTLTVSSERQQFFSGTKTNNIVMPVVSTLILGQSYEFFNLSGGNITIRSSGNNTIMTVLPTNSCKLICVSVSGTGADSWVFTINALFSTGSPNLLYFGYNISTSPILDSHPNQSGVICTFPGSWTSVLSAGNCYKYSTSGSFVVPSGVDFVVVHLMGGGGSGGQGGSYGSGGGGGGSGELLTNQQKAVSVGQTITISVGAGGNASYGGDTTVTFPDLSTVTAYGGAFGADATVNVNPALVNGGVGGDGGSGGGGGGFGGGGGSRGNGTGSNGGAGVTGIATSIFSVLYGISTLASGSNGGYLASVAATNFSGGNGATDRFLSNLSYNIGATSYYSPIANVGVGGGGGGGGPGGGNGKWVGVGKDAYPGSGAGGGGGSDNGGTGGLGGDGWVIIETFPVV